MTTTVEALRAALPAGRLKFGMIPVPMGATRVTVAVDRRRFGAFTGTVQWQLWLCVDNASWAEWGAGTAPSTKTAGRSDPRSAHGHAMSEGSLREPCRVQSFVFGTRLCDGGVCIARDAGVFPAGDAVQARAGVPLQLEDRGYAAASGEEVTRMRTALETTRRRPKSWPSRSSRSRRRRRNS